MLDLRDVDPDQHAHPRAAAQVGLPRVLCPGLLAGGLGAQGHGGCQHQGGEQPTLDGVSLFKGVVDRVSGWWSWVKIVVEVWLQVKGKSSIYINIGQ